MFLDANRDRKLVVAAGDFSNLQLSPEDGFLLSQIDGRLALGDLLHVLPFPPDDVAQRIIRLREQGVIRFGDEPARGLKTAAAPPPQVPRPASVKAPPPASPRQQARAPQKPAPLDDDWDDISTTQTAAPPPGAPPPARPSAPDPEPLTAPRPTTPPVASPATTPSPRPSSPAFAVPAAAAKPNVPAAAGEHDEELTRLRRRMRIQKRLHAKGDPFEILGVKGGAKPDELREAFHRLSRLYHPDRYFRLKLPDDLKAELEELFDELQQVYERVSNPEYRRAEIKVKAREQRGAPPTVTPPADAAAKALAPETADAGTLAELANDALAHGQYAAARMNLQLAAQLAPGGGYENKVKLVELLEKVEARIHKLLDDEALPDADGVRQIEEMLAKLVPILPNIARLLREFSVFLYLHGEEFQLLRTIYGKLRQLNEMPETLILGARIFIKGGMPQTALDLLDEAKAHEGNNPEIKRLRKEAKRRLSA